jgi:elongation factor Tu
MALFAQITHRSAHERINIVTLGQIGHGKTTLLSALTCVLARANDANTHMTVDQLEHPLKERVRGISIAHTEATYTYNERQYLHVDYPSHANSLKGMIAGLHRMNGAILVVSALDGPQPQTQEQVHLALQVKVPALLVFINKMDQGEDQALLDVVELEVRELLVRYGLASTDMPIVRGSALQALESKGDLSRLDPVAQCIWELLETMETCIPCPLPAEAKPLLMQIEDVFDLKKRGIAAVGYIERGVISAGEHVEIIGMEQESRTVLVTGIEMCQKTVKQATAGNAITCFLSKVVRENIGRGQVLALPGSIQPSAIFVAHVYILTQEEGGRRNPFFNGYRTCFFLRFTDIVGEVTLPDGIKRVMPGDTLEIEVRLCLPMAIEEGMRFAIREGGRVVGVGICTQTKNSHFH